MRKYTFRMATPKKTPLGRAWGAEIAYRRTQVLKLSVAEFAERLGVTPQMVRYWEKGQYVPSSQKQSLLIKELGIDPVRLSEIMRKGAA